MPAIETSSRQSSEVARCSCNSVELELSGKPLFRGFCHCTTCQAYTGNAYSDVTIFRAADVSITNEAAVAFTSYQKPPLVQRGKCTTCQSPTHEKIAIPALPDLVVVSTEILPVSHVVQPSMHIFYHRRINSVTDNVPRYSGYVKSQIAFMSTLIRTLWRSRGRRVA